MTKQPVFVATKPVQVRQGDVLITPFKVQAPPTSADCGEIQEEGERIVLAHGEVTGHAHAIYPQQDIAEKVQFDPSIIAGNDMEFEADPKPATLYKLYNICDYINTSFLTGAYLHVRTRCFLRHEEHSTIVLPPGHYGVLIQHEITDEELRRVAD